jgi:hypothetical protein
MSADDRRWLLERFAELEATLAHLDRCDDEIALLRSGPAPKTGASARASRTAAD